MKITKTTGGSSYAHKTISEKFDFRKAKQRIKIGSNIHEVKKVSKNELFVTVYGKSYNSTRYNKFVEAYTIYCS